MTDLPTPSPAVQLRALVASMQRAPTTPSLTAILRALWAHTLAQIAKGLDGVWVHPADLLVGPKDTSDRLYVEVGGDVPEDAATLLREVAGKVKRGETRGEQSYCLGGYAFLVSEGERSTPGAVEAALPPWTTAMGEACLQRLIARAEKAAPGWDGLPELKSHVGRMEYQASAQKMAVLGLLWFDQIPVEVLPYLPRFFEVEAAPVKHQAAPHVSLEASPVSAGHDLRDLIGRAAPRLLLLAEQVQNALPATPGQWWKAPQPEGGWKVCDLLGNEQPVAESIREEADADFFVMAERVTPALAREVTDLLNKLRQLLAGGAR